MKLVGIKFDKFGGGVVGNRNLVIRGIGVGRRKCSLDAFNLVIEQLKE